MPDKGKSEAVTPVTSVDPVTPIDLKHYKETATVLAQRCVRKTQFANLHASIRPSNQSGNYGNVKVISPIAKFR